jgi:hypothetical protein
MLIQIWSIISFQTETHTLHENPTSSTGKEILTIITLHLKCISFLFAFLLAMEATIKPANEGIIQPHAWVHEELPL